MSLFKITLLTLAVAIMAGAAGCGQGSNTNANTTVSVTTAGANTNATAAAPAATAAAGDSSSAGTPTQAYKAAYAARKDRDAAALKKLMSKDLLEFLTEMGQIGDKKQSLDEILLDGGKELKSDDTRNEKINGDRATVEYRDEGDDWDVMDFVKEDGVWKMTLPAADDKATIESDPKSKKK
jgi:hypothetical protein